MSRPVATVVLSNRREEACWLPERVVAEARFFLARVETESEDIEQQIRRVLQRPSVIVSRASTRITGAVRTRGDYSMREPHGTPAYWRAAIGLLKSEAGLIYDLQDYGRLLEAMEAPVIGDQSVETETGIVEAIRKLLAGVPSFTFVRGGEMQEGARTEGEELLLLDAVVQDLQNDPELLAAFVNLRTALADPRMRPTVLAALKVFARVARKED